MDAPSSERARVVECGERKRNECVEELVWETFMVTWVLAMSEFTTVHVDAPGLLRSSIMLP